MTVFLCSVWVFFSKLLHADAHKGTACSWLNTCNHLTSACCFSMSLSLPVLFLCFLVSIFNRKSSASLTSLWQKAGGGGLWGRDLWVWMYLCGIEFRYMFHFLLHCLPSIIVWEGRMGRVYYLWLNQTEQSYLSCHMVLCTCLQPYKLLPASELWLIFLFFCIYIWLVVVHVLSSFNHWQIIMFWEIACTYSRSKDFLVQWKS